MTTVAAARRERVRSADIAKNLAQTAYFRLMILLMLFAAAIVVLLLRMAGLALFEHRPTFSPTSAEFVPERGDIVDRNGEPFARTIAGYAVWYNGKPLFGDRRELAQELHRIFPDTPADTFYRKLKPGKSAYLRKRALPTEARDVHALGEFAIELPREPERLYPERSNGAHIVGFVNQSGHGASGMEKVLDKRLTDPVLRRQPVALSIDVHVQGALQDELQRAMTSSGASGAAGVVLDVETGEVLAMATLPSFDPNKVVNDKGQVNAMTSNVYELGSTFKPLTVAAALDAGTVRNLAVRYDATKPLRVGGFTINDSHPMNRWLNVPETLVHSSNIVTAQIADRLGQAAMERMFRSLGFHERPKIELGGSKPLWPSNWGRLTNMTVSYGHGISVTPLHLASAYAALVNGGIWRPVTLLKIDPDKAPKGRRVFSAATSARMRQMLRMIVVDGTGRKADAPGFRVGGKTGSADKAEDGGYNRNAVVATFAAAFPMDNPRYVVLIMMDDPKAVEATSFQRTAGFTAAPVVGRLVPRIGPMLDILPDTSRDVDVSELTPLLWSPKDGG